MDNDPTVHLSGAHDNSNTMPPQPPSALTYQAEIYLTLKVKFWKKQPTWLGGV